VREQIRDKLPYQFEDKGEQSVKNIARPVRVYALRPAAIADLPALRKPPAPPVVQPPIAPRLSIVVLPFANLSNDPEQQYFADGITEDLTTDLSRLADMFVISRNTAFTYRNKPVDTRQVGRELGVRYVLEGSVRRSGNQVRVSVQLIDAETDAHLWAERFDGDTGDLFALQDEITSRIAIALNLELISAEAARASAHPDALDYILKGRAANLKPPSRDKYAEAIRLFERALALDPHSVEAQSELPIALMARVVDFMSDSAAADIVRAEGLAGQALAASPRSPEAHRAKGQLLRAQRRYQEAIPEYETAIALNRNWVNALHSLAECKLYTGSMEETISLTEQAIRLSPRDPQMSVWCHRIGQVHLLESRIDEAILWHEKARSTNPELPYVHGWLASEYGLKGETERAAAELTEARRLTADGRYSSIAHLSRGYYGVPKIRALFEATYFAGLRKAGLPEE
jgi:adenylate cyclase